MTENANSLIDLDYIAEHAACLYEDGENVTALLAIMDDSERAAFTDYCDDINRKNAADIASRRIAPGAYA